MRISPIWKEYRKIEMQYENTGRPVPSSTQHEYETRMYIENLWRTLNEYVDRNAISKVGWEWLNTANEVNIFADISPRAKENVENCIDEMDRLRKDFVMHTKLFTRDGYTLTKEGRKRLQDSCSRIGKQCY